MCGIAGVINLHREPVESRILNDMADAMKHRGPDDAGVYVNKHIGLAHRRLSIIDLTESGHQPMSNEDSSLVIVHNGEIYNYLELKDELEKLGHRFRSKTDTEVILHAYEEWQDDCLARFNGMWAFAIYDVKNDELFLSRDRFGVKPLYYYADNATFIFASEIKSLLKHPKIKHLPNDRSVFNYLASGYGYMDISDETFFSNIKQVKPGHYARYLVDARKFFQLGYWDLKPSNRRRPKTDEEAYRMFYELFEDAVRLRLRSDVPLGVSLSGGLDSSSIACVAANLLGGEKLETFSSCFDEASYDERPFINAVLKKTGARSNLIFAQSDRLFEEIEEIIWHQDEPYSTLSIFPQWYVMKMAREKGVKVLLSGQGGDETLAGYHKYYFYLFADLVSSFRWNDAAREIREYRNLKGNEDAILGSVAKIILSNVTPEALKKAVLNSAHKRLPAYLNKDFAFDRTNQVTTERMFSGILNNDLYNALKISPLPSLLHIDDRSSMAHSVETRAPFLDYRLVEYLFSLGPEFKIRDGITKYILRQSMKNRLPEEVRTRRDKMGFATPLDQWFKTSLKDKVREIINSKEFLNRPYFDRNGVQAKFSSFLDGKEKNSQYTIWSWVNLELWLRKFIDA